MQAWNFAKLTGGVNCNNYIISFSKPDSKRNFQNPSDKHIKIRYNKVNKLTTIGFFKGGNDYGSNSEI